MAKRFATVAAMVLLTGCSEQLLLKGPMTSKCEDAKLHACPELVDGAVLYIEGNKPDGAAKMRSAVAENEPDDLRRFGEVLKEFSRLEAIKPYAEPLKEIAAILTLARKDVMKPEEPVPALPPASASAPTSPRVVSAPLPANVDFVRFRTRTVVPATDAKAATCEATLTSGRGTCATTQVFLGPFVVSDLYASGGCGDELFVYSSSEQGRRWTVFGASGGVFGVHGARLVVPSGDRLYVGARNEKGPLRSDPMHCGVTLSGWRPTDDKDGMSEPATAPY